MNDVAVTRMAQKFEPPAGTIIEVRVSAVLARKAKKGEAANLKCNSWELILPEITYVP